MIRCLQCLARYSHWASSQRTTMTSDYILETQSLTKEFKGFVAVSDVNLPGAIFVVCLLAFRRGIVGEFAALFRR